MFRSRRRWTLFLLLLIVAGALAAGLWYFRRPRGVPEGPAEVVKLEAPPDLQKQRDEFLKGRDALQRDEGAEAVRSLSSFDFGSRAVEEYRLYYLANAHQLAGNAHAARATLAKLFRRDPQLIYAGDASLNLGALYASAGDCRHAAAVYSSLASRTKNLTVAGTARWNAVHAFLVCGDVAGATLAARDVVIHNPAAKEADDAVSFLRAVDGRAETEPLRLTHHERLTRATALLASNNPQKAFDELEQLAKVAPASLAAEVRLQRGIALQRLKRYEDSNKVLEPLTSGEYKIAIPALRHAARNYAVVASAINPTVTKTVKERKRVGSVKVRVGKGKKRRTVTRPKYQTVFRQIKLVDLAKKKKKDEYERLASERLKDVLSLQVIDLQTRLETLEALAARAEAKSQSEYLREVVPQILKLDPNADPALQFFWDRGWAAYTRGDLASAQTLFRFIADTYTNPNVRRQSEYWYARTIERAGKKAEANAIYQRLAEAPYLDIYAIYATQRGAKHTPNRTNPLEHESAVDWGDIAEREMPKELRLAYELTALGAMREAFLETRANASRANTRFAEALNADVYYRAGNLLLTFRSLRRAWPRIATPEQDSVPTYFLKMYYPIQYADEIGEYAQKQNLDPHLVQGLIHQESYYNPKARSRVGATGLMQLMPPTAREHARRLGLSFGPARLEDPDYNIRLGTYHLRMLMNLFGGKEHFAVAAYNAGQGNVLKWRRSAPRKPMDEFLESIPFDETRGYVKRVAMLKAAYKRMSP